MAKKTYRAVGFLKAIGFLEAAGFLKAAGLKAIGPFGLGAGPSYIILAKRLAKAFFKQSNCNSNSSSR